MPRIDGGLLSCWRQTARRRGSMQDGEDTMHRMMYLVGRDEKGR